MICYLILWKSLRTAITSRWHFNWLFLTIYGLFLITSLDIFSFFFFFFFFYFLFFFFFFLFFFWLCWVFVSVLTLSLVVASGDHSSSRCAGLPPSRPPLPRSTGSRCAGSVIVAHGPSCSAACGILPDQGPNPCPLHWQADSQPLRHQGSPLLLFLWSSPSTYFCASYSKVWPWGWV